MNCWHKPWRFSPKSPPASFLTATLQHVKGSLLWFYLFYCSGAAVYLRGAVWPDRENGKLSIQTELPFPLSQHPMSISRNPHTHTHKRGLTLIPTISLMSQKPQFCSFIYNRELKYCSPVCTLVTWCTATLSGQSTNLLVHCTAFSCDSSSVHEFSLISVQMTFPSPKACLQPLCCCSQCTQSKNLHYL